METRLLANDCGSVHATGLAGQEAGDVVWLEKSVIEQMFADLGRPSFADVIRS